MSLRYALLGLLARESLTGYDLTKRFDSTVGFFWSAKHSQIYPELANLTSEGLVTFELITQTSKPNKKIYTITAEGRDALRHWVETSGDKRNVKDPLLMRIWVVGMVDPAHALAQLREIQVEEERRWAQLREADNKLQQQGADQATPDNVSLGAYMALRCGQMQYQAYAEWLKWAIAQLEQVVAAGGNKIGAGQNVDNR
jgi:DNA-binding PadR family transcriptional regulator